MNRRFRLCNLLEIIQLILTLSEEDLLAKQQMLATRLQLTRYATRLFHIYQDLMDNSL